jgi:hypothetical protein
MGACAAQIFSDFKPDRFARLAAKAASEGVSIEGPSGTFTHTGATIAWEYDEANPAPDRAVHQGSILPRLRNHQLQHSFVDRQLSVANRSGSVADLMLVSDRRTAGSGMPS